ncbi:hypothetical protein IWX90DRAFT_479982 [Phyllosticta citrichinensis]|uniref:Uncharacterized protein n=1 Tax=Phyllosticta citrichinensis TaxID=1130410 RepID=A0ABR1XKJ7_9PEZI
MSDQELDTHNLLCHGFVELVELIRSVDEDIKILLQDAGKCIIMDIQACKRLYKAALQEIVDVLQKLRLPVGQSLFAIHATLNKMLPSPEPLDVGLFGNHECRPRDTREGLKHGSICLKLIEAHIGEIMHHPAFGLHSLIEKLEQIFFPEEKEQFAEDSLQPEGLKTFQLVMQIEDPLSCDRAMLQQSLDKIIACHQVNFMARLIEMNECLKNYHKTVMQILAELDTMLDDLVSEPSSRRQVARGTGGFKLKLKLGRPKPRQSPTTSTPSVPKSPEETGDAKRQASGDEATRFDGPSDGH